MNRGENSDSIPIDLIPDILSRLPAKSIARFHCVSKLWRSLLCKPYFTELFLTRSSSRPRLLIGVKQDSEWFLFSSPQPHNPSSVVVSAEFHMKISFCDYSCSYASGLLYFPDICTSDEDRDAMHAIYNPSTGQYAILPEPRGRYRGGSGFLGFDPIGKQFKVMVNGRYILTLGTEKLSWRTIQCPSFPYDEFIGNGICINGVLYSGSYNKYYEYHLLSCFDVRSEEIKFVRGSTRGWFHRQTKLVNYKGKLGLINREHTYYGGFPLKLHMWVLEDIDKEEFSTYVYTLRTDDDIVVKDSDNISVVGATASGEIVLVKKYNACEPFYVFYFNPERNILRSVEIQGLRQEWVNNHVHVFVEHVDQELNFDVMKARAAATSISRPEQS